MANKAYVGSVVYDIISKEIEDWGLCDPRKLTITIQDGLPTRRRNEVLFHEMLHAVVAEFAILRGISEEMAPLEELLVERLTPALLVTFRQNPKIIAELLS